MFNVATGHSITIFQLYETLKEVVGKEIGYEFAPMRPGDVKDGRASIRKIQDILSYSPRVSLKEGLNELISHMQGFETDARRTLRVSN